MNQQQRAEAFADLHTRDEPFVIPNPWDAGSARLLTQLGFAALATTSAGVAFSRGHRDDALSRDDALANARVIVDATHLPVSADLQNGYDDIAETIRLAAEAGLVGGSIEDAHDGGIYPFDEAVDRVRTAVAAARELPFRFTLTARAENFLYGTTDLADTIRRLQAFAEAGADVLYAPGLPDLDAVHAVCAAVDKPVNVLATPKFTVAELAQAGASRISLGSALARAALHGFLGAAREIAERGTFTFDTVPFAEISDLLS